jgi:hypothetical protein
LVPQARQAEEACKPVGVQPYDHIIVGKDGHTSLKGLRLIETRSIRRS